jgi:Heterogeneous nuclear ribonucleoprotein Q acidic domain
MKAVNRALGKKAGQMANNESTTEARETAASASAADDNDDDDDLFGDADEAEPNLQAVPVIKQEDKDLDSPLGPTPASSVAAPQLQPTPMPASAPAGVPSPGQAAVSISNTLAIPRKHHSLPNSPTITQSHTNLGAKYGLPHGVKIPQSVEDKGLLHGKIVEALRKIPVELMNEALTEYDDAVQIKGESIRNHAAYLFGVIKRYVDVQETRGVALIQPSLAPAVQRALDGLVRRGYCTKEEMDEKVRGKIRMLSERDALIALDELSSVERSQIRNFGSYLMGIIVKKHRHSTGGGGSNIGGGGNGNSGHGRSSNRLDSRSSHHDSGNDRNYRGSSNKESYGRYDRERSRDRSDDRSRNDRRNDDYRHGDRDQTAYGPSQSNQGYLRQPLMGGTMQGQPQQMPTSMSHFSQQQQQSPYVNQYGPSVTHQQSQQFVPQMGSMPAQISQHNQSYPPQNLGHPPQNQNYPPQHRPGPEQPHQSLVQPLLGPGQVMMQQPYSQHQQAPFMQNQPAIQMMNQTPQQQPPYMQRNQMPGPQLTRGPDSYGSSQPSSGGWQQQQQMAGPLHGSHHGQGQGPSSWQQPQQQPLDILGLADKAASAVQQLAGQNMGYGGPQPAYSGHSTPLYASIPPPGSNQMLQSPPGPAMSYSNAPNPSLPPPYNTAMTGDSNYQHSRNHQHNNQQQAHLGGPSNIHSRKGKVHATTTATLIELPVMVQYAVNVSFDDSSTD